MKKKSNHDLLLKVSDKKAKYQFISDTQFKLHLGGRNGSISWLKENGRAGDGSLDDLSEFVGRHRQLSGSDTYRRIGITHDENNQQTSFLGEIDQIKQKKNGVLVITATLQDEYNKIKGKIDNHDITGQKFRKSHNEFIAPKSLRKVRNVVAHIDTFTHDEIQEEVGTGDLQSTFNLNKQVTTKAKLKLPNSGSFDLLNINKSYGFNGSNASLNLKANVTPAVGAQFNTAPHWWDILDWDEYSLDLGVELDWSGSVSLDTGTDSGSFPLTDITIPGPSKFIPISGFINANLDSGVDLSANATLAGLASSYKLGASQTLGFTSNISLGGIKNSTENSGVQTTVPNFDDITGLGLSATASPYIELDIGVVVPDGVPFFSGDSLASLDGKIALPIKFDMLIKENDPTATISIEATYDAGVKALTFFPGGGIDMTLASGQFFTWTSDNLI